MLQDLLHHVGAHHVLVSEVLQGGDRSAPNSLAQEVLVLDVLHHRHLHLVKEVDGQVAHDGPLDEQHIAFGRSMVA